MNPKLEELVHHLLMGAASGAFRWTRTPEPGVYRLMLDKGLVRIYHLSREPGRSSVGCTVLNAGGDVLHDVQVPGDEGGQLVQLYDHVEVQLQQDMDELLTEVRNKLERSRPAALAGQQ
jgi:hypothetical protein